MRAIARLLLVLVALVPAVAAAQSTRITGVVRTADAAPVPRAVVRIDGAARPTLTDGAGRFTLLAPGASAYLHVRAVGIVPIDTIVQLDAPTLALVLVARRQANRLDTARVTASSGAATGGSAGTGRLDGFESRRSHAIGGVFLTRDSIERSGATAAVDLVRRVPGARLERTPLGVTLVRFPRCAGAAGERSAENADGTGGSIVQLFVDGAKVAEPFVTLASLTAADVEAMEVYRSASELPAEARGDGCAAIMIWTRHTVGTTASRAPHAP